MIFTNRARFSLPPLPLMVLLLGVWNSPPTLSPFCFVIDKKDNLRRVSSFLRFLASGWLRMATPPLAPLNGKEFVGPGFHS